MSPECDTLCDPKCMIILCDQIIIYLVMSFIHSRSLSEEMKITIGNKKNIIQWGRKRDHISLFHFSLLLLIIINTTTTTTNNNNNNILKYIFNCKRSSDSVFVVDHFFVKSLSKLSVYTI